MTAPAKQRSELIFYARLVRKGKKTRIDLTNRVLGFTFEDHERKADKLTLTVDNWDLRNFDTPVWAKGNEIEFSWGYVGNMAPARQVTITKVTGSTTLKVEGVAKSFIMDRVPRSSTYEEVTRSDVARQIAERYGYGTDVQDIEDTKEVLRTISQPSITDAAFLRRLANKEGFEFYIDFDGFHFHSRRTDQPPSREYVWFNDRTGTIKEFNIENDITVRPGFVRVKGRDLLHKKDYVKDLFGEEAFLAASPEELGSFNSTVDALAQQGQGFAKGLTSFKTFGEGLLNAAAKQSAKAEIRTTSEPTERSATRKAKGELGRRKQLTVKMSAKVVGDPGLIAKSVIRIGGIGERLSGNYYLKSAKHTMGSSGYDCDLTLIRDGHNRVSARLFEQVKGEAKGISSNGSCEAYVAMELGITKTLWSVWMAEARTYEFLEAHKVGPISEKVKAILSDADKIEVDPFNAAASYRIFQNCLALKGMLRPNGRTYNEVAQLQKPAAVGSSVCNTTLNQNLGNKALNDDRTISVQLTEKIYGRTAKRTIDKTTGVESVVWVDKRGRK